MADDTHSPTTPTQEPTTNSETQLEFPQLLLEASFASLLSNSQSSQPRTEVPMPRSEASLSESWSQLSEHDLLPDDDDLQSNATDTGSLIDVNNTGDVHTFDEPGDLSDTDNSGDSEEEQDDIQVSGVRSQPSHQPQHTQAYLQDSIRLEDSTVVVDASGHTSLQASKTFTNIDTLTYPSRRSTKESAERMIGTIQMSLSPENLKPSQSPYHILYYASPLSPERIKRDVLGKIGAALISPTEDYQSNIDANSPCYQIVPIEFGPGSRSDIADLIPIPNQIHVTECAGAKVSFLANTSDSNIDLVFNNGKHVISRRSNYFELPKKSEWKLPDLIVVVASSNDSQASRVKVNEVVGFARRHNIAVLCLRQEAGWGGDDFLVETDVHMLHKYVQVATDSTRVDNGRRMLVDVDAFLALDIKQLNQHLNYLNSASMARRRQSGSLTTAWKALNQYDLHQFFGALGLLPPKWVIDVLPSDSAGRQTKESVHVSSSAKKPYKKTYMCKLERQVKSILWPILVALISLYACQLLVPYLMSINASKIRTLPAGGVSTCCPGQVVPTAVTTTGPSTVIEPLRAHDQQLQRYLPLDRLNPQLCRKIVPTHRARSVEFGSDWFGSDEPKFDVHVVRGDELVKAKVKKEAGGVVAVSIKREELYGELTVLLEGPGMYWCGTIDLKDSLDEALTKWLVSLHESWPGRKSATKAINTYKHLLEIRPQSTVSNALGQRLGAVLDAVEKTTVRQAKLCHQHKAECFMNSVKQRVKKDLTESAHRARVVSEEMLVRAHSRVVDGTRQARGRMNEAHTKVQEDISKAVQMVQDSVQEASEFARMYSDRMKDTLNNAQHRAQTLVKKPRSHRRKGRRN